MRLAGILALVALVALVIAMVTDSSLMAIAAIAVAAAGILLLLRDWRADRRGQPTSGSESPADEDEAVAVPARMSADMFAPDISADADGPSSDARAD